MATPSIQSKRAEAKRVAAEIQSAQHELELKIERYNLVHEDYLQTKENLKRHRELLSVAKGNLKRAEEQLAASLEQSYKSSGQDVVSYLLAAQSFNDLIDHVQILERASDSNSELVETVANYKRQIADTEQKLEVETAKLAKQQAEVNAQRQQIENGIAALHRRENQIDADIKRLIEQQQAAQDAAAAAAVTSSSGGGGSIDIPIPPSSTLGGQAVAIAMQYLGTPYVYGGSTPSGFDCSGFTMYVWSQLGVGLPHNAAAQYGTGTPVPMSALEPGDLVFFDGLGHVGMYVGGGAFIHSPHTGDVVKISSLSGYYSSGFVGARRVG